MTGERPIEIIAVILGVINITLLIRRSIWNYPFGIVMVCLYSYIFLHAKLYSESILQIYFFVLQLYGWYYWAKGKKPDEKIKVERLPPHQLPYFFMVAVISVFVVGTLMGRYTDAAFPFLDATVAVLSVIAQFMMARRLLENWIVWIGVDLLAIGIYWSKELQPTAVLYIIFLIMATIGLRTWFGYYKADTIK